MTQDRPKRPLDVYRDAARDVQGQQAAEGCAATIAIALIVIVWAVGYWAGWWPAFPF